jgi:hypothetical protein
MQSIRESVHQLQEDQITRLGMQGEYLALSEELRIEIEHLKATDPDEYEYSEPVRSASWCLHECFHCG